MSHTLRKYYVTWIDEGNIGYSILFARDKKEAETKLKAELSMYCSRGNPIVVGVYETKTEMAVAQLHDDLSVEQLKSNWKLMMKEMM